MAKIYSTVEVCMSDYSEMSYTEKVSLGKIAYNELLNLNGFSKDNALFFGIMFCTTLICCDSSLIKPGQDFISEVMSLRHEYVENFYNENRDKLGNNHQGAVAMGKMISNMPKNVRDELMTLALSILTIDGRWTDYRRKDLLKELFDLDDYFESSYRSFTD